jgi:DNA-directed RNA polymerase specialized sigma24 family protein
LQTRDADPPALTATEIKTAIEAFPPVHWLRLHKVARALCRHTGVEPEDLLQDAFRRALDGARLCPRDVDILRFLAGVMRSIASDWSKARKRRAEVSLVAPGGGMGEVVAQIRDPRPNADEWLAKEQEAACMRKAVLDLFADDIAARRLLDGIMDGREGDDLRSLTGLSETAFASKRRLIRRRIDKAFPRELKP